MEEKIWTWTCRICAVVGFLYLLLGLGFENTPSWAFILLIGLFFGGDAMAGNIQVPWKRSE